ncbi:polyprotein [Stylosanthes mosaic-associated virus 1]|nr:polyprotein [Stylosanthes mosaic-associated virus 1]
MATIIKEKQANLMGVQVHESGLYQCPHCPFKNPLLMVVVNHKSVSHDTVKSTTKHQPALVFGTITADDLKTINTAEKSVKLGSASKKLTLAQYSKSLREFADKEVSSYEQAIANAFGCFDVLTKVDDVVEEDQMDEWEGIGENIITSIDIDFQSNGSRIDTEGDPQQPELKESIRKPKKKRVMQAYRLDHVEVDNLDNFIGDVVKICMEKEASIEVIGSRLYKFESKRVKNVWIPKITTRHEMNCWESTRQDILDDDLSLCLTSKILRVIRETYSHAYTDHFDQNDIVKGMSGCIMHRNWFKDAGSLNFINDVLVVMGRNCYNGRILNALAIYKNIERRDIDFYSEDKKITIHRLMREDIYQEDYHKQSYGRPIQWRVGAGVMIDDTGYKQQSNASTHIHMNRVMNNSESFEWGSRGECLRELFSNKFSHISLNENSDNFDIVKINNNHKRVTASSSAVVEIDLKKMQDKRAEACIQVEPITTSCRSSTKSHSMNSISCGITEGKLTTSGFIPAMPGAMIISDGPENIYVKQPQSTNDFVVPKEGYCYLTIFQFMFLSVEDRHARNLLKNILDHVIPQLGTWPTLVSVAHWVANFIQLYPEIADAPAPILLIHHGSQTIHVIDSLGSRSAGYHMPNIGKMNTLASIAYGGVKCPFSEYTVGGISSKVKNIVSCIRDETHFRRNMVSDPLFVFSALSSPSLMRVWASTDKLDVIHRYVVDTNQNMADVIMRFAYLCKQCKVSESITKDVEIMTTSVIEFLDDYDSSYYGEITNRNAELCVAEARQVVIRKLQHDMALIVDGHFSASFESFKKREQHLIEEYQKLLEESTSWRDQLLTPLSMSAVKSFIERKPERVQISPMQRKSCWFGENSAIQKYSRRARIGLRNFMSRVKNRTFSVAYGGIWLLIRAQVSSKFDFMNFLTMYSCIMSVIGLLMTCLHFIKKTRQSAQHKKLLEMKVHQYEWIEEVRNYAIRNNLKHLAYNEVQKLYDEESPNMALEWERMSKDIVKFEDKDLVHSANKFMALIILIVMLYDGARADLLYKSFTQVRNISSTIYGKEGSLIQFQDSTDAKAVVEIILKEPACSQTLANPARFGEWIRKCVQSGNITSIAPSGTCFDFTRRTAIDVCAQIVLSKEREIMVRGFVGSGKSTYLPHLLAKQGKVLICEPYRVLCSNVTHCLEGAPFFESVTMHMRGNTDYGSGNIVVATSGFAFNLYANNRTSLANFDYIILDECHNQNADTLAMRSLLRAVNFQGKIIHVSATPPGNEVEFHTMFPVEVENCARMSIEDFGRAQGCGSKTDVSKKGENILVYVASYREVDSLCNILTSKGFRATKVDARTISNVNGIDCTGTRESPLYLIATNIVENGVTLNVDVVVDFGFEVEPHLDEVNRQLTYDKKMISYGQRIQRNGRVGRLKNGLCINIGDVDRAPKLATEIAIYEAAVKCFVHNLPPPIDGINEQFLENVTRAQAQAASNMELNIFLTIFLFNSDGAIPAELLAFLKKFQIREAKFDLTPSCIHLGRAAGWKQLASYKLPDEYTTADLQVYVPFFCHDFGIHNYIKLGKIIDTLTKSNNKPFLYEQDARDVLLILETNETMIDRSIAVVQTELTSQRQKLQMIGHAQLNSPNIFVRCATKLFDIGNLRAQQSAIEHNIQTLEGVRMKLENFKSMQKFAKGDTLTQILSENPDLIELIKFQGKEDNLLKGLKLKGRYDYTRLTSDVIGMVVICFAIIFVVVESVYMYITSSISFEGKKFDRLRLRDKKMEGLDYSITSDHKTLAEVFGEGYTLKGSRAKDKGYSKQKPQYKKKNPFNTFYGFDMSDYDNMDLIDETTGAKVEYTKEEIPTADFQNDLSMAQEAVTKWDHITDKAKAVFTKKGMNGEVIKRLTVDLTAHEPLMLTSNSGIQGYPEHKGDLRQTGTPIFEFEGSGKVGVLPANTFLPHLGKMYTEFKDGVRSINIIQSGSKLLMNAHHYNGKQLKHTIFLNHGMYEFSSTAVTVFTLKGFDVAVIQLPQDIPPARVIKMIREPVPGERVYMIKVHRENGKGDYSITDTSCINPIKEGLWSHEIDTECGECGSPLVAVKDKYIVGFHMGRNNLDTSNLLTPVSKEILKALYEDKSNLPVFEWQWDKKTLNITPFDLLGSPPNFPFPVKNLLEKFTFQDGTVGKKLWVAGSDIGNMVPVGMMHTNFSTKHIFTGIHKWFEAFLKDNPSSMEYFKPYLDKFAPSNLNGEAFKKDFFKYSKPVQAGNVDCELLKAATWRVIERLKRAGFQPATLDFIYDTQEIIEDMNVKAAMGAQYAGKKEDHFDNMTMEQLQYEHAISLQRLHERKKGVWKGSLKAELRPIEKIKMNKTRVFTAAPYDVLLGAKTCVDAFNHKFYETNTQGGPWTVGINKFNRGWHKLMEKLPEGWTYGTGDGSQFDSSIHPILMNQVLFIRKHFMRNDQFGIKCLENLYHQIIWTPVLTPDGSVLQKMKGNNSGQPSTVVDNTLIVMIATEYHAEKMGVGQAEMDEYFKYFCNGDDIMFAIKDDMTNFLDCMHANFGDCGLNYIFEDKTKSKEEIEYMSLRAIKRNGIYIPKLSIERIVAILSWERRSTPKAKFDAINAANIESWGYDDLTYQIRKYLEWLIIKGYDALMEDDEEPTYHTETALHNLYCEDLVFECDGRYSDLKIFRDMDIANHITFQESPLQGGIPKSVTDDSEEARLVQRRQATRSGDGQRRIQNRDPPLVRSTEGDMAFEDIVFPEIPEEKKNKGIPKIKGKDIFSAVTLLGYRPPVGSLDANKASQKELEQWQRRIMDHFGEENADVLIMGFMVYCIENGTSPNIFTNEQFPLVKADGTEQLYDLTPFKTEVPSLRAIMRHFSGAAIMYITNRRHNDASYMPRLMYKRGLRQGKFAPYAFDFLDERGLSADAREVVAQMKAAALEGSNNKMFNLDGSVKTATNTERHTTHDVTANTHGMQGTNIAI